MADDDSAKRSALASRMSSLLGLPTSQIEQLIPLISPDNLDRLDGMGDAEFLRESTKLINQAQRQQLDAMDRQAEASQEVSAATADAGDGNRPKLRPLRKPGEAPALRKISTPPGLNETATAGPAVPQDATATSNVPRGDMGGLRRVGEVSAPVESPMPMPILGAEVDDELAIDPLTGLPKHDPLAGPPVRPMKAKGDVASFTPSSHSTARADDLDPENDGGNAPKPTVMAPAEKPPVRAEGEETAESKIPDSFGAKTKTKSPADAKKKKTLMIVGAVGAVFGLVLIVLFGLIIVQMLGPEPQPDEVMVVDVPPPEDPPPGETPEGTEDPATTTTDPVEDPVATTPAVVRDAHQDALVVTGALASEIEHQGLLVDATSFTVEMWVKVRDPVKVQEVSIDSGGENPAFSVRLIQGALSGLQLRFSLAEARQALLAPPPEKGKWTHIVVEYDGQGETARLLAYINGELSTETVLAKAHKVNASMLRFRADVSDHSGILLLDEIRVSSGLLYGGNFKPERKLSVDAERTLAYFPMERDQGAVLYDTVSQTNAPFTGGIWIGLAEEATAETAAPLVKELKLPPELLEAYAKERGEGARQRLVKMWDSLSDEQKRKFLEDQGLL